MTKGDIYTKENIKRILDEGCLDKDPRPKYADGTPAHTISVNHVMNTYELDKGESPLITLRPIAIQKSIGEILWIYRDADSNIFNLEQKYGVRWWRDWILNPYHYDESGKLELGSNPYYKDGYYYDASGHKLYLNEKSDTVDPNTDFDGINILDSKTGNVLTKDATIGSTYGSIIKRNDLFNSLLNDIKTNPDGRRHIINMWQVDDFKSPHGLKPCAYQTEWNVRHGRDGLDYLDMCLFQRSSDFMTAGCINQTQYVTLLYIVAKELGYKVGRFTWFVGNIQIYDRHIEQARELLERKPVECNPKIVIDDDVNLNNMMPENIHVKDYPRNLIKEKNPQMKFDLGI